MTKPVSRRGRHFPSAWDSFAAIPLPWCLAGRILLVLCVAGVIVWRLPAADLRSSAMSLQLRDGVVVGLSNHLSGEALVVAPTRISLPAALHRLGEPLLRVAQATEAATDTLLTQSLTWPNGGRFELRAELDPGTGEMLITQSGASAQKKLVGISWSLADIPDRFEVLVPGCSGQRFSAEAPAGRREFDYPLLWEASFVLIQGREGGVLIRAEDDPPRYQNLVVEHARGVFRLRFESRTEAPFERCDRIEYCRWRLTAYRGPWQTGAAIYRSWAESRRTLIPLEQQRPAWVRDIRFVVTMNLDTPLLAELARRCQPARTLLYLPGWRRDEYDRNYPDYTATTNFDAFVSEAHRLGFRVMPHVNYFGCDPKHPRYAQFKPFQMRDPFNQELLWWEWPADPPIRFAYINPASRAWRELFIARLREVAQKHRVDAFHLDQTLCIYNDANGRIDGLTCLEGNLALHRELRAALPEVALSGEGLNEITGRHEAFAQRHVWGMDHAHGTWDDRLIALSHPISSAVLTPYTQLYGYLGMANPGNRSAFVAWRRAYEQFGVLPTYPWPDAAQLTQPPPYLAEVLAHAQFFQQQQPVPDYDAPWATNELFVYRLANGGRAAFRRDQGVVFGTNALPFAVRQAPFHALSRRIEGVNVAHVAGSLPGWPAYDEQRVIGLDPRQAYPWSARPRDPDALHITDLPEGVVLEQSGIHPEFARFRFRDPQADPRMALWSFGGEVVSGVRFPNDLTRTGDTLDFEDDLSGGAVHPEGEGLFLHPPWKHLDSALPAPGTPSPPSGEGAGVRGPAETQEAADAARRRPATFIEFALRLPSARRLAFESGVHLRAGAIGKSDGVTFRVQATRGTRSLSEEIHHDRLEPKPLRLDLSAFAGAEVRLRLEVDAGPKSDPSFDWARFASPVIAVETDAEPVPRAVALAGVKSLRASFTSSGQQPLSAGVDGRAHATVPMPGTLMLALTEPAAVSLPCDLLQTQFSRHVVYADGIEGPAFSYFGGSVTTARCGEVARQALSLHPPPAGRSLADYLLRLPDAPARLVTAVGIRDGSKSKGVGFAVQVNGELQFGRSLHPGSGWVPVSVDLARWRGQPVLLTLATDAEGSYEFDWAVWAEPRLERP